MLCLHLHLQAVILIDLIEVMLLTELCIHFVIVYYALWLKLLWLFGHAPTTTETSRIRVASWTTSTPMQSTWQMVQRKMKIMVLVEPEAQTHMDITPAISLLLLVLLQIGRAKNPQDFLQTPFCEHWWVCHEWSLESFALLICRNMLILWTFCKLY